jgi:hypothetical protein
LFGCFSIAYKCFNRERLVSFTHFVKIESLVDEVDDFMMLLEQALVRSSALILPNGNLKDVAAEVIPYTSRMVNKDRVCVVEGIRFRFKHPSCEAFLPQSQLEMLHVLLENLSDSYRSAKTCLTPKYVLFAK